MSLSFGFISNDSSLTGCALKAFEDVMVLPDGAPNGWGMGYFQAEQPLLRKQPNAHSGELNIADKSRNLRTNLILGHIRDSSATSQRTENTQPFRYNNWLFCHTGTMQHFEAVKEGMHRSIPDFIRRNIRGKTDSEHLFHLFLSFLNDTGKLNDPRIPLVDASRALASTFAYVDRLIQDIGHETLDECCMITNGSCLLGIRRGRMMKVARKNTFTYPDRDGKLVPAPNLKAVMLMGGAEPSHPGWETVEDRSIITVDADLNIEYTSFKE